MNAAEAARHEKIGLLLRVQLRVKENEVVTVINRLREGDET